MDSNKDTFKLTSEQETDSKLRDSLSRLKELRQQKERSTGEQALDLARDATLIMFENDDHLAVRDPEGLGALIALKEKYRGQLLIWDKTPTTYEGKFNLVSQAGPFSEATPEDQEMLKILNKSLETTGRDQLYQDWQAMDRQKRELLSVEKYFLEMAQSDNHGINPDEKDRVIGARINEINREMKASGLKEFDFEKTAKYERLKEI